jgi:hypothetical protein
MCSNTLAMRRGRRAAALGAVAAVALASVAFAGTSSVTDPNGDTKGHPPGSDANYDLLKLKSKAARGNLVIKVKVAGKLGDPSNHNDHGNYPLLFFDVPGKVGNSLCDYKLQADPPGTPNNHSNHVKANLYKCKNTPNPRVVGHGRVTRQRPSTQRFAISEKALGKPSKVGYAAQTIAEGPKGFFTVDQAPDHGFHTQHLGRLGAR